MKARKPPLHENRHICGHDHSEGVCVANGVVDIELRQRVALIRESARQVSTAAGRVAGIPWP